VSSLNQRTYTTKKLEFLDSLKLSKNWKKNCQENGPDGFFFLEGFKPSKTMDH
jgi:hypothetical protein